MGSCSHLSYISLLTSSAGLPDAASEEAASWVAADNDRTVLIDASTAFRVDEDWDYGFAGTLIRRRKIPRRGDPGTVFLTSFYTIVSILQNSPKNNGLPW